MLDDSALTQILDDWSAWAKRPGHQVQRSMAMRCTLSPNVVTVVQGVRRCGKTTLLRQVMLAKGIADEDAVFINFEDPRLTGQLDASLLDRIHEVSTRGHSRLLTFFLDEIQNVSHWQRWLNTRLEAHSGHCYVVTGSNSQLLGGELASSLTGRHLRHELFPLDFNEFQALVATDSLQEFIRRGGFPAVLTFPQPDELLRQYFLDIIEKDIRERVGAKSSRALQMVARMVLESVGSELGLRRIAGAVQLSPDTVNHYLQACEDAYLIFSCPYFAYSEAKRARHHRKYYAIDTALRRAVSSKAGDDLGKDFENLVFLQLRRKTSDISYWKGRGEVDFVVNGPRGTTPIQVSIGAPQPRHQEALQEFYRNFPYANEAVFVTPTTYPEFTELIL